MEHWMSQRRYQKQHVQYYPKALDFCIYLFWVIMPYLGSDGESVCQQHGFDASQCWAIGCCHWNYDTESVRISCHLENTNSSHQLQKALTRVLFYIDGSWYLTKVWKCLLLSIYLTHDWISFDMLICILPSAGAQWETGLVKPRHLVHPQKL